MSHQVILNDVNVTNVIGDVATIICAGDEYVGLSVKNDGATALDAFEMHVQFHPSGEFHSLATNTAAFTTTPTLIAPVDSTVDPTSLAPAAVSLIEVDVRKVYAIKFKAKVAAGTTKLDIAASVK